MKKLALAVSTCALSAMMWGCDDSTSASNEPVPASSVSDVVNSSTSQEISAGISSAVEETSSSSSAVVEDVSPGNGCGDLWCGYTDTQGRVLTGYEDKEETSGYWYDFNDNAGPYNGNSQISYPLDVEEGYGNFFGPIIEANEGIKASITLGNAYEFPLLDSVSTL